MWLEERGVRMVLKYREIWLGFTVSSAVPGPGQRGLKVGLPEHGASSGLCRKDPCPIRQGLRWLQERDVNVTAVWTVVKQNQLCSLRRWPSPPQESLAAGRRVSRAHFAFFCLNIRDMRWRPSARPSGWPSRYAPSSGSVLRSHCRAPSFPSLDDTPAYALWTPRWPLALAP